MNTIGIALVWCVLQVTLVGLLSAGLYLGVRRLRPATAAPVALTGLLAIVALSALAMSPWPRWSLDRLAPAARTASAPAGTAATPARHAPGDSAAGDRVPPLPAEAGEPPSVPGPSMAALFWRALADELGPAHPGTAAASRRWPAVVAVVLLASMSGGLIWLWLGLWAVRSHRARSRPVEDAGLLELVDVLRAELGCRRPIEVRQSGELVTAATIGWRRPVILLPAEWAGWSGQQRRAVLAHEIVHVRRADFLAVLLGQLAVVLHAYHPLLHWLMGRLRLEQELAADAAAASLSGGPRQYLATIAELALRQEDRPLVWPARSFLPTQTSFLRRIAMLRNSTLRFERLSPTMRVLAVGAVLVGGLLVAGLRGPSGDRPSAARAAEPPAAEALAGAADEIDLKHVPGDAATFVAIRPAALFSRPELSEFRKLLDDSGGPGGEYTLPMEEIRQVTYVIPKLPEGGLLSPMDAVMVLQAKAPYDFKKFIDREMPRAAARESAGVTYYASPGRIPGKAPFVRSTEPCYLRPDDRTLVCSKSEQSLRDFIALRQGGPPASLEPTAWKPFQADHAVVVMNPASLAAAFGVSGRGPEPNAMGVWAPLWEETTALAIGLRMDDRLRLHVTALGKTPEAAEKVQQSLESVRVLAGNLSRQFRANSAPGKQAGTEFVLATFDVVDKLIDQLRFQRDGSVVTAQSSVDPALLRLGPLAGANRAALEATQRAESTNHLKQIAIAMHNYHDVYKHLPPAVLYGPDGKTPYSWRVALLPFLEQKDLYEQYRFDEPWDGPNNRQLLAKMPAFYGSPKEPDKTRASYFALVGPGTVFEGSKGRNFSDIVDGTSNTLMIVEAQREVPWTKPEDVPYDPKQPLPKLGGYLVDKAFLAALCDGSAHVIADGVEEGVLRSLIERNDGRKVSPEWSRPPR